MYFNSQDPSYASSPRGDVVVADSTRSINEAALKLSALGFNLAADIKHDPDHIERDGAGVVLIARASFDGHANILIDGQGTTEAEAVAQMVANAERVSQKAQAYMALRAS